MKELKELIRIIKEKESLAVAFSGGIDSSLVAKVAWDVLGEKAVAVTFDSEVFPRKDLIFSKKVAREIGIKHIILKHSKLDDEAFVTNSKERCYYCKAGEIDLIEEIARDNGIKNIAYGVNASDKNEHRPGIKALREKDVFFPLEDANIGKPIIPELAKLLGLSNHNMPSTTCLASRIPYGHSLNLKKLNQIEVTENFLLKLKLDDSRVRYHGSLARIEVAENEFAKILGHKQAIVEKFKELGFSYITLDLQGYRSGSMDEVL